MDSNQRVDVFTNVHKGLRRGLLELALKIGQVDWADGAEVKALDVELETILHFLREHAANEDEIQFPQLEERAPEAVSREWEDHRRLEAELDQLEEDWIKITQIPNREKAGHGFYLAFNRFLSDYLAHMDREETAITDAFYKHFSDEEIKKCFQKIIARTLPNDMAMMLSYMIPAMNKSERYLFLTNLKQIASTEVFGKIKGLAQKLLPPKEWEKLSARLG